MKKAACFFVVLAIAVNVLGLSFLNVKADAAAEVAAEIVVYTAVGIFNGIMSSLLGKAIADNAYKFELTSYGNLDIVNSNAVTEGELVELKKNGDGCYFVPKSGLSSSDQEFAEFFCDRLNSNDKIITLANGFASQYDGLAENGLQLECSAEAYEAMKTTITNAFLDYCAAKERNENLTAGLQELADAGTLSSYSFDFVGPINGYTLPTSTSLVNLTGEDISFSTPFIYAGGYCVYDPYAPNQFGFTSTIAHTYNVNGKLVYSCSWECPYGDAGVYGAGSYIIYNGEFFYKVLYWGDNKTRFELTSSDYNRPDNYYNSDGVSLEALGVTAADLTDCLVGFYVRTVPRSGRPTFPGEEYDPTDMETETGGGVLAPEIPTYEQAIMQAIAEGVLPEDTTLQIASDGTITGADGLDLATIEDLLDKLNNADLDFEDIDEAMSTVAALLRAIKVNTNDSKTILGNIRDYLERNGVGALKDAVADQTDLLERIADATEALTQSLAIPADEALEREEISADGIVGVHIGLAEATEFVSQWTIVNQCRTLLGSIMDENRYTDTAPNFKFYWDSDNDGTTEEYIALDLSFLDTPLTNSNLSDKGRFTKQMTVREFLQQLIIFICYTAFIIKVLRKLPGLVSGGESAGGDALELKAIDQRAYEAADMAQSWHDR